VALTRATRQRDDLRQGSSVRGAIDVALVAAQLAAIRGVPLPHEPSVAPPRGLEEKYTDVVLAAMLLALSGRDQVTPARARQIARRLSVPRPPRDQRSRRGVGELVSLSWSGGSDELDLERTLEAIAGIPHPEGTNLVVRERVRQRRSVVLVVDVSGSMKGERVRTAAATVGALVGGTGPRLPRRRRVLVQRRGAGPDGRAGRFARRPGPATAGTDGP